MFRLLKYFFRSYRSWMITALLFGGVNFSLSECVRGEDSIANIPLYYSLGGSKATNSPASDSSRLRLMRTNLGRPSTICGSFNPSFDIQEMLSDQLNDTLTTLSSIPQTITSALPGYILCRAKPGLCQLLQHYVVRAENKWNLSVKSCEESMQDLADGNDPFQDLVKVSKIQEWQKQAVLGSSATEAKRKADNADGCVVWVGGKTSGCSGKEPIWLTQDTTKAGWCLLLNQESNCTNAPSRTNFAKESILQKTWSTPDAASDWITDVIGDYRVQAGENSSTVPGTGLLPKIDEEAVQVQADLTSLVYSAVPPHESDMENLRTNQVSLSASLIDALRDLPDREFLIARISNEIALSRIVDRAFLARRLLLSGLMEPNIQSTGTAPETIHKQIEVLEREIERVTFEMQISRRLVSDTILNVLGAHRTFMTPASPARRNPPSLLQ